MEFTIYSIGDSEFLEQVLIALAMIGGYDDFGAMVQVGLAVGVFATVLSAIAKGGRSIEFQHVLLGYIIWATMFVPTARVNIEDSYTGDIRVVDNVPMGPAAAGGIITLVGYKLTEMFEIAYNPIVPKVTETEFAESLKILTDIRNKSTQSSIWRSMNTDAGGGFVDLETSWVNYIKDCSLKKVDLGFISSNQLITEQFENALRFESEMFGTQIFVDAANPNGQDLNCTDAWTELNDNTSLIGEETVKSFNALLGFDDNNLPGGESSVTKTNNALDALLGSAINSQTYMKMAVLEPVLMEAASGKYNQIQDMTAAIMINQAIQQRNTQWAAEQSLFMTIVRPMLAFFEAFIYAVAPIMAFVIVLGAKGIQLAGKYFTMLIWIQLWMPLLSIVNLYIYTAATRKLDVYSQMGGHNWDSFYALNTAADTMQTWIATGGLLASSTPAIALMLIYGSAVTATHLAGRLRSSDAIDEKYQTPDIKNNAPMANVSSMYSGDSVSGLMLTGAQGALGSATISSVLSNMRQSGHTLQNTESEQFSSDLAHSINQSATANEFFSKATVAGAAVKSGDSEIAANARTDAKAFMEKHGIDDSHTDAIAGVAGLSASLGANLDVDKAAGYLAGQFGVARAAAKKFLQDAGVKGAPGTGLVPVNEGSGDGSVIDIKAGAKADVVSQSKTNDQTQSSYGQQASTGGDYRYSDQEQAQFNQELSSQINRQDAKSFQKSWGTGDAMSIRKSASELVAATQTYQTASGLQSTLGAASSMQMRTIGALAAGRDQGDMIGNPDAQRTLDGGWNAQPESVKSHAEDLYNRYSSWGMPQDVARNTARLTALTDSNNFKGNPAAYLGATMLAADVIRKATGIGGTGNDFDYDKNSGLDKPGFTPGDIKEKTGSLKEPDVTPMSTIQSQTQQPTSTVFSEQGELPTEQLRQDHAARTGDVQASGSEAEQGLIGDNEAQFRNRVLNPPEMSTSASIWGAYDNSTGWIGRRAEQIAGGTEAFLSEFGGGVGEAYDTYRNLSPEQADQFRTAVASQDDALFDSLGIAGLPVKGAQIVGNHIIGATVAGVDAAREWMNGGTDLSQAAQGMSIQEKGAFFAAAAGEAAREGGQAFSAFMDQYGSEFKDTMQQIGQHQYGLTPKQSAIFAESYDTNDESMRTKVLNFQQDYAIRDDQGNPVWDSANNQWSMTPENKAFTEAVVDRITTSTSAGDRVGSYLEPISGYNVATRSVTPGSSQ